MYVLAVRMLYYFNTTFHKELHLINGIIIYMSLSYELGTDFRKEKYHQIIRTELRRENNLLYVKVRIWKIEVQNLFCTCKSSPQPKQLHSFLMTARNTCFENFQA